MVFGPAGAAVAAVVPDVAAGATIEVAIAGRSSLSVFVRKSGEIVHHPNAAAAASPIASATWAGRLARTRTNTVKV
jgi:hypothetical protein